MSAPARIPRSGPARAPAGSDPRADLPDPPDSPTATERAEAASRRPTGPTVRLLPLQFLAAREPRGADLPDQHEHQQGRAAA